MTDAYERSADAYDLVYDGIGKDYEAEAAEVVALVRERRPAARTLLAVLGELADGFRRIGYPLPRGESVRAGLERVLGQELRHAGELPHALAQRPGVGAHVVA